MLQSISYGTLNPRKYSTFQCDAIVTPFSFVPKNSEQFQFLFSLTSSSVPRHGLQPVASSGFSEAGVCNTGLLYQNDTGNGQATCD